MPFAWNSCFQWENLIPTNGKARIIKNSWTVQAPRCRRFSAPTSIRCAVLGAGRVATKILGSQNGHICTLHFLRFKHLEEPKYATIWLCRSICPVLTLSHLLGTAVWLKGNKCEVVDRLGRPVGRWWIVLSATWPPCALSRFYCFSWLGFTAGISVSNFSHSLYILTFAQTTFDQRRIGESMGYGIRCFLRCILFL